MEKEILMELIGETECFTILPSGQLRYLGNCPECGRKNSVYYRKKEGYCDWICHNRACMKKFTSHEILGLVEGITTEVLNLWLCLILDGK